MASSRKEEALTKQAAPTIALHVAAPKGFLT